MSFILVSAEDIHYGPTSISTEDQALIQQISDNPGNSPGQCLTISRRTARNGSPKSEKSERIKAKFESKMKELKDKPESERKAEKLKEKMERLMQRERERIGVIDGQKVKFDPSGKSLVIKVEDAPVRVLNKLVALGYQITPSSSGSSNRVGQVWTMFRPGYMPQMIYPELNNLNLKP